MIFQNSYYINEETVLIVGFYDQNGFLCSKVIEGNKLIFVRKSPQEIINKTLLGLGSSLDGARDSSKELLGNIRMHPIHINSKMGVWLFPTRGFAKPNCAWFSLMHVKSTERAGARKTKVILNYNHTVMINMKESHFNQKKQKAQELREIVTLHTQSPLTFYLEPKQGIQVIEDEEENYYLFTGDALENGEGGD